MNKFYVFVVCLFLSVNGIGCNNRQSAKAEDILLEQEEVGSEEEEMFYHRLPDIAFIEMDDVIKNVSIHVDKKIYESVPNALDILILNKSGVDITTESVYEISKMEADEWVIFDMNNIKLAQQSHSISAGGSDKITIDLLSNQFAYSAGTYRIQLFFEFEWGTFE